MSIRTCRTGIIGSAYVAISIRHLLWSHLLETLRMKRISSAGTAGPESFRKYTKNEPAYLGVYSSRPFRWTLQLHHQSVGMPEMPHALPQHGEATTYSARWADAFVRRSDPEGSHGELSARMD